MIRLSGAISLCFLISLDTALGKFAFFNSTAQSSLRENYVMHNCLNNRIYQLVAKFYASIIKGDKIHIKLVNIRIRLFF